MGTLMAFDGAGLAGGRVLAAGDAGTGDTAITAVSTTPTISATDTPYGTSGERSYFCDNTVNNNYASWTLAGTQNSSRVRFYFKTPPALGSGALNNVAAIMNNATRRFGLTFTGTGNPWALRIVDGASVTLLNTPNNTLAASTWFRVEFGLDWLTTTTGNYYLKVWNVAGTLLYSSGAVAGNPNGTAPNRFLVGESSQVPILTTGYAHVRVTDVASADIGIWTPPVPAGPVMTAWSGTAETAVTVTRWSGTAEIPVTFEIAP